MILNMTTERKISALIRITSPIIFVYRLTRLNEVVLVILAAVRNAPATVGLNCLGTVVAEIDVRKKERSSNIQTGCSGAPASIHWLVRRETTWPDLMKI